MPAPDRRLYGMALVAIATVFWSTAGLFVRAVDLDVWSIAGWRSFFAGCSLMLLVVIRDRGRLPSLRSFGWTGVMAAVMSALSMFSYIAALKLTTVANVLTVYATVPFAAAALAYLWSGERAGGRVLSASVLALVGIVVMVGGAFTLRDLAGNALSLVMTVTFAVVLVMVRRYPGMHVAFSNSLAAFLCAGACALLGMHMPTLPQFLVLGTFGFVTTALAYLLFLTGGRYIPSGEAGLIGLLDVILGPLWVWLAFAERPSTGALIGGAIVLGAVVWYIVGEIRRPASAVA